jgi:F-type H+-transporting ATPase subunit a
VSKELEVGKHWLVNMGPLQVHMDTLIMTWVAMIVAVVISFVVTRCLKRKPGKTQTLTELIFDLIENVISEQLGKEKYRHFAIIASIFLFILTANLIGHLPWKLIHLHEGELASPTNDLNVTLGLALIVSVYYISAGIAKKGFKYFKHYLEPVWFMAPFNLLEDITKPATLALRLFANIFAGEIIIMVLMGLCPIGLPVPMMLFELFVAFIQAFIFAILTATYINMAISDEH